MKWFVKYLLAILPPLLFLSGWKIASWAYKHFECQGHLKGLQPCYVGDFDIVPLLGFGLFWYQILWYPAIAVSGWLLLRTYRKQRTAIEALTP